MVNPADIFDSWRNLWGIARLTIRQTSWEWIDLGLFDSPPVIACAEVIGSQSTHDQECWADVNITNILCAAFLYKSVSSSFYVFTVYDLNFLAKGNRWKSCSRSVVHPIGQLYLCFMNSFFIRKCFASFYVLTV